MLAAKLYGFAAFFAWLAAKLYGFAAFFAWLAALFTVLAANSNISWKI
ncbi:hypothetical protein [Lysinibacillus sphaericus]|nr:hypothetical protein [Lysinibacillus sp. SDF0037]